MCMPFKSTGTAKYFQLSEMIREQIASGMYGANEQLPTEEMLCNEYSVSRGTVRKAMDLLEQEQLIRREQGKGAYVNAVHPIPNPTAVLEYRHLTAETLIQTVISATGALAARLAVAVGDPIIHIEQLFYDGQTPVLIEKRFIPEELCPLLSAAEIDRLGIRGIWEQQCKHPPTRVRITIESRSAPEQMARLLRANAGNSIYFVERLVYTQVKTVERPMIWYQGIYRGDDPHFGAAFSASI